LKDGIRLVSVEVGKKECGQPGRRSDGQKCVLDAWGETRERSWIQKKSIVSRPRAAII